MVPGASSVLTTNWHQNSLPSTHFSVGCIVSTAGVQSTNCSGDVNQGSFLIDYAFNRHFDVYAGVTFTGKRRHQLRLSANSDTMFASELASSSRTLGASHSLKHDERRLRAPLLFLIAALDLERRAFYGTRASR